MHRAPGQPGQFNQAHLDRVREVVHRSLRGQPRVGYLDEDDLVMEISAHVAMQLHRFSVAGPASLATWIERVARNRLRDIVERENAQKRGAGVRGLSLDADDEDSHALIERLSDGSPDPGTLAARSTLREAIGAFARTLSPNQRETLLAVYRAETLQAAADALGISRPSLHGRLKTIARAAEDFGLRKWLEPDA